MKVLVITRLPNAVWDAITSLRAIVANLVDWSADLDSIQDKIRDAINNFQPDLILTYRCPYILPKAIYTKARYGAYNIHPALLPRYPGLNPWPEIMRDKDMINGVTLHRIDNHIDAGEIVAQCSYSIRGMSCNEARVAADKIAGNMVMHFFSTFQDTKEINCK